MIKLIAFDLDGTALHNHAELSERNRRAMEQAAEQGIHIVPATGRVKNFIPPCLTELPFIRYAITSNGGAVWDLHNDRLICGNCIPTDAAIRVQQVLEEYPIYIEHYIDGGAVVRQGDLEIASSYFGIPKEKLYFLTKNYRFADDLTSFLRETNAAPEKINLMFLPQGMQDELLAKLKALPDIALTYSNVDSIEINAASCHKGTAIRSLADVLGLDISETMAVGDNGNDLEMLRTAGFSVVVGNGIEEAKAAADAVVAPCEKDGFAEAIELALKQN